MKRINRKKSRSDRPTLPELDQTKKSVLNSLASLQSRRSYQHAMDEFIDWYCSEPRLALNRGIVLGYRLQLEAKKLAASTINVRLAAVRRLAYEAADTGLLKPGVGRRHPPGERRASTRPPRWQLAQRRRRRTAPVWICHSDASRQTRFGNHLALTWVRSPAL